MFKKCLLRTILPASLLIGTAGTALAQEATLRTADPSEQGSLSAAEAKALFARRPLPFSAADEAAKAAADKAHAELVRSGRLQTASPSELIPAGIGAAGTNSPVIGVNIAGQNNPNVSPPDTTGAIGPNSYIQLVNETAEIYTRAGAPIASGTLDTLAGTSSTVSTFDPQIIWDPRTSRFYYTMDSIFSGTDNRLSFGFSTTANPTDLTTSWCHYTLGFGSFFPDYPKLGDSSFFAIIGFNGFSPGFVGSGISAVSKPPAGTTCPAASRFKVGTVFNIKDTTGAQTFTPVPANQVDALATGYVVTRNGALPSTNLWIYNVTRAVGGAPVFGAARPVAVPSYTVPANATQPSFTQLLDTLDARPTNAVQAFNPATGRRTFSLWTQNTIAFGTTSEVRVYEINPVPATPVLLRTIDAASSGVFLFNGSVSPDRRRNVTAAFGDSVVFNYNVSSAAPAIFPRIVAGSSLHGAVPAFTLVMNGVDSYRDFTCPSPGNVCRWGDYSGASADPAAPGPTAGQVWGANQFDGVVMPGIGAANWRTQIFSLAP